MITIPALPLDLSHKRQADKRIDSYLVRVNSEEITRASTTTGRDAAEPSRLPQVTSEQSQSTFSALLKSTKHHLSDSAKDLLIEFCGITDLVDPKYEAITDVIVAYLEISIKRKIRHYVPDYNHPSLRLEFEAMKVHAASLDLQYQSVKDAFSKANALEDVSVEDQKTLMSVVNDDYGYNLWLAHQVFRDPAEPTSADLKYLSRFNKVRKFLGKPTWSWNEYLSEQAGIQETLRLELKRGLLPAMQSQTN